MRHRVPGVASLAAFCLSFLAGPASAGAPISIPTEIGEAIVGFEPQALPALAAGEDLAGFPILKIVRKASFVVLAAPDLATLRLALARVPGVAYVEDNALLRALATPDDTRYGEQYGPGLMGFPAAWDEAGFGSADVTVAVLDTGLQKTHPDFESSRILQGHDYVNDDANPNDDCGHGTHVSGTVAATTDNARGVAGMSQATILPMKVLSPLGLLITITCSGSTADIAEAIVDATDEGARVISMSLGGGGASNTLRSAVDYAWQQGVLVVAAAGNDGPCSNCVNYPAKYANAIAVSAVAAGKGLASYSSTGPEIEVAAPGSNVLSTYNDSGYRSLSGTSMATPHVSGALALALSCRPATSATTLRALLHETAEDLGAAGRDDSYGHGLARIDRLVDALGSCDGGGEPGNHAPIAAFTLTASGLTVGVDGSESSDPDGDALSYLWDFGAGGTATGAAASHTYAAGGTYTITLAVNDGNGGSDTEVKSVTVTAPGDPADPDPATPNLQSGQARAVTLSGTSDDEHFKIFVPAGSSQLRVAMTGPSCGLLSCSFDADLYVRRGSRATDTSYDCRPYLNGSNETCTLSAPASGWWYVRVDSFRGSGTVQLTPTVSP
ncbi:MAG: S8 family serine peptidase [Candidatus Binatia bacterium]